MNKAIATYLIFLILIFSGCSSGVVDTNPPGQRLAAPDQKAIRVSASETNSAEPAIAADLEGNIYVVYVEHDAKSADVYLQKLNKDAEQAGEKVRVNPEKGTASAWFGDAPTIRIGHDNVIYLGWTAKDPNSMKSNATALNLSVSRDLGKSFDAPVKVNDDTAPSAKGMHSLAIGKNNRVVIAWLDERNIKAMNHATNFGGDTIVDPNRTTVSNGFEFEKIHDGENHNTKEKPTPKIEKTEPQEEMNEPNSEIFAAVSDDGGKTFSKNQKVSSEVCPCCKTSLAIDEKGTIYASWRQVLPGSFRHIAVASSENGGKSFSEFAIVSDDKWEISACPVSGAPMFIDNNNSLKIFWYTAGEAGKPGLYSAVSKDRGKTFLPRDLVYEGAVKGTVSVFPKNDNEFGAFFDGMGEIFKVDQNLNIGEKFEGELPAAAFSGGKTYVAFVKKTGEKNAIWLRQF